MRTKRWQRRLARVLAVLFILLALLFYFLTQRIATDPYFESTYYIHSIAKMDEAVENAITAKGALLAGFARVNITPNIAETSSSTEQSTFRAIKMAGYGDGQIATGIHDSLFAKAIAIEVGDQELVFLSADLVLISEQIVVQVVAELEGEIRREQLIFGATHTHASIGNCVPGFVGEQFMGEFQPEVLTWLSKQFVRLIREARKDKKPSKFATGYVKIPHVIRNRIIGETGRLNDKMDIVSFTQESGKQAVIGIFGAHATTLGAWNDKFSGDYPGYFQRSLEANGVDMALFFAGTVGSHSYQSTGKKFEKSKYVGETLADSARAVLPKMQYDSLVDLTAIYTELEIPELQAFYVSEGLRLAPWAGQKLLTPMKSIPLQGIRLNDLVWIAVPYELSGEYGLDLKNALELAGYHSALTSFNGQYLGYIVPQKYYYYDTYEAQLMGWYGPSMGDYLMELNFKLANALTHLRL
ncbi:MAG: neutral/alkaline non-lysosomal ceramidase N-terminal domain-containing protein [Bacteroidota bacterium]